MNEEELTCDVCCGKVDSWGSCACCEFCRSYPCDCDYEDDDDWLEDR